MVQRTTKLIASLACVAIAVTACGDDDSPSAATATSAEDLAAYGATLETECPGEDPGFDPFLAEHPDPTADDWAAFLPSPLGGLTELRACIADSDPPAEVDAEIAGVVAAMDVVIDDLGKALAAAEADDVDQVNAILTEMNSGHVEAIETATQKVMEKFEALTADG